MEKKKILGKKWGGKRINTVGSRDSKGTRTTVVNGYVGERWKRFKQIGVMPSLINADTIVSPTETHNWISTCKRMMLHPHLTPYTNINLRWIKNLVKQHKTLRRKRRGKSSGPWVMTIDSWIWHPKHKKQKADELDFIKI